MKQGGKDFKTQLRYLCETVAASDIYPKEKARQIAYAFYTSRLQKSSSPNRRLAALEASLRLSDSTATAPPRWILDAEREYLSLRDSGAVPDWVDGCGAGRDVVVNQIENIRRICRLPAYIDPLSKRDTLPANEAVVLQTGKSCSCKLTALHIDGYRASPGKATVDLSVSGKPASIVIFGDNGVGKSTFVSAIELATQGTVGRKTPTSGSASDNLLNIALPRDRGSVEVELNNGTSLHRTIERLDDRWTLVGPPTPFEFSLAPISLQRNDIVEFVNTPGSRRGQLFVGQFLPSSYDSHAHAVKARADRAKEERREFTSDLSARAGVPARVNSEDVNKALQQIHLDGLTPELWRRDKKSRLPPEYIRELATYKRLETEIAESQALARRLPQREMESHAAQVKRLGSLLGDVGSALTESVLDITGYDFIESVKVSVGRGGALALNISVLVANGAEVTPEHIFSEGVQDLFAVLFFLEVAKAAGERGQAKVLILDDVIQSVDATVRRRLLHRLTATFSDWQLIVTCHDRLWREHVREAFKKNNIIFRDLEIRSWSFDSGPQMRATDREDLSEDLRRTISAASGRMVAGAAGVLLERICDRLSWTIPVSVVRSEGDRYGLGALWTPVYNKLSKTSAFEGLILDIERFISLRNQLGAHYNAVADAVSDAEADHFGDLVIQMWEKIFCSSCHRYVDKVAPSTYSCRCGLVNFST